MIVDTFPFHDELDVLEMRLTELYETVDWFVVVEADVTHQNEPKPSYYWDNRERFSAFADKIVPVWATGLPTLVQDPDPWARELSQREHIRTGLDKIGVDGDAVILQSDVDEIPRPLHVRNCRPGHGLVSFGQRGHFWAVDWLYPHTWYGTVAGTADAVARLGPACFGAMRTLRNHPAMRHSGYDDAGWHFSWLGGPDRVTRKVNSFCHPEVEDEIRGAIDNDNFYWREGFHVDGARMAPVDVNAEWPRWIVDGNAPGTWYRPR